MANKSNTRPFVSESNWQVLRDIVARVLVTNNIMLWSPSVRNFQTVKNNELRSTVNPFVSYTLECVAGRDWRSEKNRINHHCSLSSRGDFEVMFL